MIDKLSLKYSVLTDAGNLVARKFGLVFELDPGLRKAYEGFGLDLGKLNVDGKWELPVPATFVLDHTGAVVFRHMDPDYTTRVEPEDVVDALKKLQPR